MYSKDFALAPARLELYSIEAVDKYQKCTSALSVITKNKIIKGKFDILPHLTSFGDEYDFCSEIGYNKNSNRYTSYAQTGEVSIIPDQEVSSQ